MTATPEVSVTVIVALYNMEKHLARAIQSVQDQTLPHWELIIVDDASTDDSLALARAFAALDDRITVVETPSNHGPSAARNRGMALAKGDWIAILDADDTYAADRLATLHGAGEAAAADFVADNQFLFDDALQEVSGVALAPGAVPHDITLQTLVASERPGSPFKLGLLKPLMRRAFLQAHDLKYREDIRFAEDFYLYAEMLLSGAKAIYVETPHYYYTTPVGRVSGQRSGATKTVFAPGLRATFPTMLAERHGAAMDSEARAALADYGRWNRAIHFNVRLEELRDEGRVWPIVTTMLANPNLAARAILRPLVRSIRASGRA